MSAAALSSNFALQSVENAPTLHPIVAHDPKAHMISSRRWSKVWTVATLVTAVAFIALAAFAVGYAALFLEAELPIITLVALLALYPSSQVVQYPWDKACAHDEEAKIDQIMIEKMKDLNPQKISEKLKNLKIKPGIEPEKLKSVMARYEYSLKLEKDNIQEALSVNLNANATDKVPLSVKGKTIKISPADYSLEKIDFKKSTAVVIFQALQLSRWDQEIMHNNAAMYHLKAAYLLKLMENPYETRDIESFGSYRNLALPYRLISKEHSDPGAMTIFVGANKKGYNTDDILKKNTQQLAKEIFGLKTTSLWG